MKTYSLSHLSDHALLRDLAALVAQDRTTTASMLAHLAEVDERKLYLPAAHPSMYSYCVHELRLSEDSACKRIRAARAARQFPAILAAVAEGRLHLGAVVLLAPYLTPENADELVAVASLKSKTEIERLIAERFPRPDVPARVQVISPPPASVLNADQLAPGPVEQRAPRPVELSAPGRIDPRPKTVPLAPRRFALQLTMSRELHDKLQYAQELLSHQVPSGNLAEVLDRALDALIGKLEKQMFAATLKPRPRSCRSSTNARHIPANMKRAVWQRDQGRCTFVSEEGQRCSSRKFLEFDHIDPVTRGGEATVERHASAVSGPQPIRSRVRVRNRVHELQTAGGSACRGGRACVGRRSAPLAARQASAHSRRGGGNAARHTRRRCRTMFQWNWVLVIAGALMILGEVALGGFAGFDFVLIGSAFVIGGGIGLWVGSPSVGLIVASILCITYVAVGRRFVRRRMHAPNVPTNTDALLGREGIVLQRIAPHQPGQVKINDEIWRASVAADSPRSLEPGDRVTIAGVDGVTLQVR